MKSHRAFLALLLLLSLLAGSAQAHIGSPDVFFDGKIGPYPASITIRMPSVVPGRAEIEVHAASEQPLQVFILPLFSKAAVKNSPPPDPAPPVAGEPGLYHGELWLMRKGGYSVEVRLRGAAGEGVVQIPITSEALHQLAMPRLLATILLGLGGLLFVGGLAIVRAAASESTLPPGVPMDRPQRRAGLIAVTIATVVCAAAVFYGLRWWNSEEADFQSKLRQGAWPDLTAEARLEGAQRLLRLTIGEKDFPPQRTVPLLTDHGKLLHVFLIGEHASGSIAHLHPIRESGKVFETVLPPLPEGDYQVFVDLTLADSGISTTTTAKLHLPPVPTSEVASSGSRKADPDDSWASCPAAVVPGASESAPVYRFEDGLQIVWKEHPPLRVRRDARMQFEVRDAAGQPVPLEPYMGMISHAAVMRADGSVFAHLHPSGNFSMAAQSFFESKVARETAENGAPPLAIDHSKMHHGASAASPATFSLPYEFPSAGNYHVWVQFKTGGEVRTARFEATVLPAS